MFQKFNMNIYKNALSSDSKILSFFFTPVSYDSKEESVTPIEAGDETTLVSWWSVYSRLSDGRSMCIADCESDTAANELCGMLTAVAIKADKSIRYSNLKNDQLAYLLQVNEAMEQLQNAACKLCELWHQDVNHHIDLNDYLTDTYPFDFSLDEKLPSIVEWKQKFAEHLLNFRNNNS